MVLNHVISLIVLSIYLSIYFCIGSVTGIDFSTDSVRMRTFSKSLPSINPELRIQTKYFDVMVTTSKTSDGLKFNPRPIVDDLMLKELFDVRVNI